MTTTQTKMIKDLAHSNLPRIPRVSTLVPIASFESPLVHPESIDTQGDDVGVSFKFEMGE